MKEKLRSKSQWIIMGILEILTDVLLLVNPVYFTAGIVIAAGILLILGGLMNGYRYFKASPAVAEREGTLVLCLIGLALGGLCVAGTWQVIAAFPVLTVSTARLSWSAASARYSSRWTRSGTGAGAGAGRRSARRCPSPLPSSSSAGPFPPRWRSGASPASR